MSEETEVAETPTEAQRYDILVVCQNRAFNVVEQGLKSVVNYMAASGYVRVYDEAIAEQWTEVYGKPGATAHEMFVTGTYSNPAPVYYEMAVRSGLVPTFVPYGPEDPKESCYFWIDIRGALFNDLIGITRNKLKDVLHSRIELFVRPHTSLPPHAVVGDDEKPVDKRRQSKTTHRVGTAVEEL